MVKKCCFKGFNRIKKLTNGVILCYSKETIVMITIFHALLIKKATERIQFGWVSCVRMMKKGGGGLHRSARQIIFTKKYLEV